MRRDAVVVAAGSSRRMGGIDKLTATVAGRPLLAWSAGGDGRGPGRSTGSCSSSRRSGSRRCAAADWLPAGAAVVAGGGRRARRRSRRASRHLDRVDPDGGDRPVLVHDGARPLASPALVEAVVDAVAAGTGRRSRSLPVAETLKRVDGRAGRRDRRPRRAGRRRRRPRAPAAGCCSRPGTGSRPTGRPSFTDEAALLEACTITVHAIPGEPSNLKVTLPDDLARVERRSRAGAPRVGFGHDSHPFGPGCSAPPRRHRDRRRARARRPLRRRRGAARGRRRAARRGGPWATSAACSPATSARRARIASALLLRDVVARLAAAGLAPGVGRRHDHRRAPAPRAPASTRCAAAIAGALGLDAARGQRQGLDRQPGRRRGRGPDDLGARRRHACGARA